MCDSPLIYSAKRVSSPPTIDGDISEFFGADSISLFNLVETEGTYYLLWDDDALYIACEVSDEELNADETTRDGSVYMDDAIELFFDTLHDGGTERRIDDYKFIVNLLNVQRDSQGVTGTSWDIVFSSQISNDGLVNNAGDDPDVGYAIEIAIPWSVWGVSLPTAGSVWGFDLAMDDKDSTGARDYTPWMNSDDGTMNNPDGWGDILFSNEVVSSTDCSSGADGDFDSVVSISELIGFIGEWKSGDIGISELLSGVGEWKSGC